MRDIWRLMVPVSSSRVSKWIKILPSYFSITRLVWTDSIARFQDLYDEIKHHRKILVLRLWDFGQKVIRENVLVVSRILLFPIYTSRSDFHLVHMSSLKSRKYSKVPFIRYLLLIVSDRHIILWLMNYDSSLTNHVTSI